MTKFYRSSIKLQFLSFIFLTLAFQLPLNASGSSPASYTFTNSQSIDIFVSCVEDLGNGKYLAHFGYENPNETTYEVYSTRSVIYFNSGRSREFVINSFEPGVHEKVFSQEFDAGDWVKWIVRLSWFHFEKALANSESDLCVSELEIIPGYNPPIGGKEYNSKIGAELTSLHSAYNFDPNNFEGATDHIFQLEGTKVLIEVVAESDQYEAMIASLEVLGFDLGTSNSGLNRGSGWVEIADLLLLNEMAALRFARPVYPGVTNYIVPATGLVNSQGDFSMHSDFARLGYDVDGSGIKIGVLSNSYDTKDGAALDVQNGDLPGAENPNGFLTEVDVLLDIDPGHGTLSDEGRAMLQIVHDIAPGAELAFRTGFLGEQDMANGIRELAAIGADLIVDDLSYITEPFFRDGMISHAIDEVAAGGVTFFSSAGNFGRASYTGVFDPEPAPSTITGTVHDFSGTGDVFQNVLLPEGDYTLVLQWDDGSDPTMNTTTTDLDLFLTDDTGASRLGFNRENIGYFPIEVVPFSVVGDSVYSNVVIARASGPDVPVTFKYILFRGGSQFQMLEYGGGSSTIVGHPNAVGAITVGAVRFDKNPVYNPSEFPVPVIMSFSSVGGTPVSGEVRAKPDISAPNGVNTTVDLGNGDWDSPIDPDVLFPNFFGTSAASPHAAGVAALIMEAKSVYDPDALVDPDYIRTVMKSTAIDMDNPGEDHVSGSGFIQAHKTLMTFANPSPYVENLILASEGGVPGEEITPFSFTVTGDFFTESTQILFRGEELESGVVVVDEGTITVDHPGFIGNPEVQVFNPIISTSGEDGGYSEGIYFSDPVKQKVIIKAGDLTKKYGEVLPDYSASFQLVTADEDTLSLEEAVSGGLMLQTEADRLSGLSYNSNALETSSAGIYLIEPSLYPEVDTVSPSEIDHALSEKYILEFVNGNLNIEKLALKITPMNMDMVYGQELPAEGFDFLYEIGDSGVNIGDLGLVLSGVQQEHTAALSNEIGLVRGVALVNGIPLIRGTALVNGVTMLRGIALVNGVEIKVEVEGSDTTVYVAGEPLVNGGSLIRGVALVNDRPFVNMTEIVRGVALVNGDQVTFDDGYMTELNGVALENAVPAVRGVALVNGLNTRGIALVNGHTVEVENGVTTIDDQLVSAEETALVNGIPVLRGVALVNSSLISRGVALVNGLEVAIENGIPTGRGVALVNGVPSLRGIALVNGLPLIRGTALVNNLEVHVLDGEVSEVYENGAQVNGLSLSRGIALVNEVALVNGGQLFSRGTALVNGIALSDDSGDGEDLVNLENMNFMASGSAIANGLKSLRGTALVNGIVGEDGEGLRIAAGTEQEDGSIVFENGISSRGVALVNGLNYVRGTALVNGISLSARGTALVNGSTINDDSNNGTIIVFDATELGDTTDNVGFAPISFVTGTTVGKHWIVPGTYISNNFDISYGLGTLSIDPASLSITAEDRTKIFGEDDPALTYSSNGLLGQDVLSGELNRDEGENVGDYGIRQGSLTAGEDYVITYDSAQLTITPASMTISITAESKEYDGSRTAVVSLDDNRQSGSDLDITYTSALFEDKHVGGLKEVTVLGLALAGDDSDNYVANTEAITMAEITAKDLVIAISADNKEYDGNASAVTYASVLSGLVNDDEDVTASSLNGLFNDKVVDINKPVTAAVSIDGTDAGNYAANIEATTTANITARELVIGITASSKAYDGTPVAATAAFLESGLLGMDAVTVSSTGGLFNDKSVGTGKQVTATVSKVGADADNYYLASTEASATADITAIELSIGITASSKAYDGTPAATTAAFVEGGLLGVDVVTVSSTGGLFDDKNVGTGKPVTAIVSKGGADADNYYLASTEASATADITARELVIGITASSKAYDGTRAATTAALVESGLLGVDVVTVSSSGGLFGDKNVGPGKPVTATVSKDGADANNYYLASTEASATADITAIELAIGITASSKAYDGTPAATTAAFVESGLLGVDVVTVSSTGGLFDDKNVGTGKPVTATVSKGGADADNYYLASTEASATADITAIGLVIGITAAAKPYDGNTDASTTAFIESGLLGNDAVTTSSSGGYFSTANAGTGLVVTANVNATGGDAGNYLANTTAMTTADINQKEVYVTPLEDKFSIVRRDPLPEVVFDYDGLIDGDEGDEGYTAIRESDGKAYNPNSSQSMGLYILTPVTSNGNYSFQIETGLLQVNKHDNGGHDDDEDDKHNKSASVSGDIQEEELDPDYLLAYPNPVIDKVHITMKDIQNYKLIQLYDLSGKSHPITSIDKRTDNLEIDMAELSSGHYFIRIIMEDDARVVQIIKK